MDWITWLQNHWQDIALIVSGVVTISSVVVKLTPNKQDDLWLSRIVKVLEVLALNKRK